MPGLYSWKDATKSRHVVDPEVAAQELDRIAQQGELVPQAVVNAARSLGAILHPEFEWDDEIAGEEWRKEQARHLIGHLIVRYERPHQEPLEVRAFQAVHQEQDGFIFIRTDAILSEADARLRLLTQALRELSALQKRYRDLQELATIFAQIDNVKRDLAPTLRADTAA